MLRRGLALSLVALSACAASPSFEAPVVPQAARAPSPQAAPQPLPPAPPAPAAAQAPAPAAPPAEGSPAASPSADVGDEVALDDDLDDEDDIGSIAPPTAPTITYSEAELKHRFQDDRASLGSISVGRAHAGLLINGVQMPRSDRWVLLDPSRAYGTKETVEALAHCIDRVNEKLPGAPPVPIGHISAQGGGHLNPHLSHQSGRDVDIGYYFKAGPARQFIKASESNLDMARTWALVKAALKETTIEMILMDTSIQRPLAAWAAENGEDPAYVDSVFQSRGKNAAAPIRHVKGHVNHIHFRFHSPLAEELGRRVAAYVVIPKPVAVANRGAGDAAPVNYVLHKARNGDTLVNLAKHYGTTIEEIQKANSLKGIALKIGVTYKIPSKLAPKPAPASGKLASVGKKGGARPAGNRGSAAPAR
ncbi:MAG: penicillin-insensitive murein endopeptidase [Byssovorax sp.]